MQKNEHIENCKKDVKKWEELISEETKRFERLLGARRNMSNSADAPEIDRKIAESDKSLRGLAKHKMLAVTRQIRAENGDAL